MRIALILLIGALAAAPASAKSTELRAGWVLRSATGLADGGGVVSQPGYATPGWYPVTLPSTVLAGLAANGVYSDIYDDTRLQSVPDLTTQNWWYRGEFVAPAGPRYWLRFEGIAYRAQIWLNGVQIDPDAVGTMAHHEYDVTTLVHPGATNALALRITPPASSGNNLSFWYVDWNPKPPDMNAGIWGRVFLDTGGPVALRDPYVQTTLPLPATSSADLAVYADAVNGTDAAVTGTLSGRITKPGYPTITFSRPVTLAAHERREVGFDAAGFAQLHVTNPALWWPVHMGNPELYELALAFTVGPDTSDARSTRFGIRQCSDYVTPAIYGKTYRGYRVNGQNVLIRGADYVWDMLLRIPSKTNRAHMAYVRDMGLNLVRFEGILGNDELYDLADENGILLMPGFVCCTYWAQYASWSSQDNAVADASLESQMRTLRGHASALVWAYGSDELPTAPVLTRWKAIATRLHWQNPTLDNLASYNNAAGSVPKMEGPYVWEPPLYWYANTTTGGAFGFCAEQGGESVPPEESLKKFISPASLWPIGSTWGYHAGANPFDNLNYYTPAVNRYGAASNVTQYADRSQLLNYETERAQFEAFGANAHTLAQGTIYWMLNNAWPSVHWNLYDYYFKPGGGYFGTKKALEPVHVLYDYATRNIKVFNATLQPANGFSASADVYNVPDLTPKYTNQVSMNFPANTATTVFTLPAIPGLSGTYFLRLRLRDGTGHAVSENLYWLSTTPDALGKKSDWFHTAVSTYANLSGLNSLAPNTSLTAAEARAVNGDGTETMTIQLHNTSPTNVAFFVRPEVTAGLDGSEVLPILYSDNDVTLFPGESTAIVATYATEDLGGQAAGLRVRGYNVPAFTQQVVGVPRFDVVHGLRLLASVPNPARNGTVLRFELARRAPVRLAIYDVAGRRIRLLEAGKAMDAGAHEARWDGRSDAGVAVGAGLYFCRLDAGEESATGRLVIVR